MTAEAQGAIGVLNNADKKPYDVRQFFPADKLARFYETTRGILPQVELARMGENIPVMYAGWGNHLSTEQMIEQWGSGASEDVKKTVRAFGVSGGWFYGDDHDRKSPETFSDDVAHMTAMAKGVMQLRGWDHANIQFATVSQHPRVVHEVKRNLESDGLGVDSMGFFGLACDGGGAAISHSIADPRMQGKPVVIVAMDNLSGKPVPRTALAMSTLFGNAGGAMAYIPGEEFSLLHPDLIQAIIQRDTEEVIRIPRSYDVDEERKQHPPTPYPKWMRVDPAANYLHSEGVDGLDMHLNEMTTQGELGSMDGVKTGLVFKNLAVPLIADLLERYYTLYPTSDRIDLALLHQPSKIIHSNIARKLRLKFEDFCPDVPWVMDDTGFNNVSPVNIIIAFEKVAEQGRLQKGERLLVATFGIGLSGRAFIGEVGPNYGAVR